VLTTEANEGGVGVHGGLGDPVAPLLFEEVDVPAWRDIPGLLISTGFEADGAGVVGERGRGGQATGAEHDHVALNSHRVIGDVAMGYVGFDDPVQQATELSLA